MSTPTIAADAAPRARYRALLFGAVAVAILSLPVIATAAPAAAGEVTTVLDGDCDNYGYDVTNHDTVPHTVTMTVGATAGAPVVVDSGQTKHLALDPNTEPATAVQITDSDGTVIADDVLRFCVTTDDITATIKANTSYTLDLGSPASPVIEAPAPAHGKVVRAAGRTGQAVLRYTPNPCFSGTDTFGYSDSVLAQTGVVTVHILPGACNVAVRRSATDCPHRTVTYTATNPYGLPVRLEVDGQNGPSDTREFTVPAHTTKVIWQLSLDPAHPQTETFTFRIAETGHALRTDTVHFPCPAPPAHGAAGSGSTSSTPPGGLANTGTPTAESAAVGVGAVVLGLGLTLAGTRRRRAG